MPLGTDTSFTVGRDQQLRSIDTLLTKIANREGGSLLFSGEPGIGKSHLLREAVTRAKLLSVRAISLRCSQSDINEPFALFSRLGALFDIPEPASLQTDTARFLYGRKTLDAVAVHPSVILIDDMQWCDYLSSVALLHLFDYGFNLGIGFLATTRPLDETDDNGTIANVRTLSHLMAHDQLVGLSKTETAALVSQATSTTVTLGVQKSLQDLTNGNPFFLLEIARLDTDINSLDEVKIPRELEAILDQRINRLSDQEEIIAMAALLGMRGERRILFLSLVYLGFSDALITSALSSAERLALLTTHNDQYEFRHALYTQRLVSRMSYTQRSNYHGAAAITFANETRYMSAMAHLSQSEKTVDSGIGETLARTAFEISQANGDHAGSTESGQWLLDNTQQSVSQRVNVLIQLAKSQIAIGRRLEGRKNAELAAKLALTNNDAEAQANAVMQWAARSDFTPDRAPVIAAFSSIDAANLLPDTRIRLLSAYSQAVLLVPTEEHVSVTSGSELLTSFGTDIAESSRSDSTESAAWNWNVNAALARKLATDARDEAITHASADISYEARVQALLAWRESHRSPAYLSERLAITQQAIDLSRAEGEHNESVYFCHILDLMESGDFARADLEIQQFHSLARAGGSFIAQWWSGFLQNARLISRGKFAEAALEAQQVFERGQLADEPGRLVIMLEQQTLILIESIIPLSLSELFKGDTALLANHYARALAALGNASLGNTNIATQLINDTLSVLDDPDQEAAWLPTVTMLIETAHLLHLYDVAARGVNLLEPYSRQHVTYIGNTIRGPVRRYCALAKHASGDTPGAIDDLLIARNESRRIGDHLWDLACSVDIVEILAESDPARAIELVPESLIIEAEASEMKWRALRGRVALTKARTSLASDLGLTPRQIKVMQGLLQNLTIIEIATSLGFSHSTVRQESIAIYKALNIEGRTAIAERARELRLI
jgi:DNA-binding CsgD family transcriptional regulator